ncbi:hypothetical protein HBI33_191940 [Parastagonospora nodorum]|nr:hypothetical protein HBI33_191940 [Parastagonospora nodorum]
MHALQQVSRSSHAAGRESGFASPGVSSTPGVSPAPTASTSRLFERSPYSSLSIVTTPDSIAGVRRIPTTVSSNVVGTLGSDSTRRHDSSTSGVSFMSARSLRSSIAVGTPSRYTPMAILSRDSSATTSNLLRRSGDLAVNPRTMQPTHLSPGTSASAPSPLSSASLISPEERRIAAPVPAPVPRASIAHAFPLSTADAQIADARPVDTSPFSTGAMPFVPRDDPPSRGEARVEEPRAHAGHTLRISGHEEASETGEDLVLVSVHKRRASPLQEVRPPPAQRSTLAPPATTVPRMEGSMADLDVTMSLCPRIIDDGPIFLQFQGITLSVERAGGLVELVKFGRFVISRRSGKLNAPYNSQAISEQVPASHITKGYSGRFFSGVSPSSMGEHPYAYDCCQS